MQHGISNRDLGGCGFLVAGAWAVYFSVISKDIPIQPIVSTLVRLTCVHVGPMSAVLLTGVLVAGGHDS